MSKISIFFKTINYYEIYRFFQLLKKFQTKPSFYEQYIEYLKLNTLKSYKLSTTYKYVLVSKQFPLISLFSSLLYILQIMYYTENNLCKISSVPCQYENCGASGVFFLIQIS